MTVKTPLLALLLTGSSLWAQIPSATPGVAATNKEEVLRQALRQTLDGTVTNVVAPVRIASSADAADAPGSLPPGTGTGTADPAVISSNGIALPSNPATPAPTNRLAIPSNPPGTNTPANRLAVPSNPVAAPAATVTTPAPAVPGAAPGFPPAAAAPVSPDATNASPDDVIPAGVINFAAVDIQEVLKIYAELVNRTILRPTALMSLPKS